MKNELNAIQTKNKEFEKTLKSSQQTNAGLVQQNNNFKEANSSLKTKVRGILNI